MRTFCAAAVLSLVVSGVLCAAAGPVKTRHAIDLEMHGKLDVGFIYRNNAFGDVYWGPCLSGVPQRVDKNSPAYLQQERGISPPIFDRGSMFIMDPQLSLGFQATLPRNVVAYIELSTPFYVIGDEGGMSPFRRRNDVYYRDLKHERLLQVEQAYVELRDLIVQDSGLDLRLGIMDYALDFRGNGHPFLIDIQNAENPFMSATGAQQYYIQGANGNAAWGIGESLAGEPTGRRIDPGPFGRNTQDAAGVLARYATASGIITWDNYWFTIFESYERQNDDFVAGSTLTFYFDEERRLGKISPTYLAMANDATACVHTMGAGAQFFPLQEGIIELYGEAYYQAGTYAKGIVVEALEVGGVTQYPERRFSTIKQRDAYAFYGGFRLSSPRADRDPAVGGRFDDVSLDFFGGMKPYVDVSYWEVSGDARADSKTNRAFVTLENNNLSLIVENSYWGLDIDNNYRAVRLQAGFYPYEGLHAELSYAYFEHEKSSRTADNRDGKRRRKIGDEIDVTVTYEYSTHVKFRLGSGFLLDPRALGTRKPLILSVFQTIVNF